MSEATQDFDKLRRIPRFAVGMRLLVAFAGAVGLAIQATQAGNEGWRLLFYYTNQSNFIITVVFFCSAIQLWRRSGQHRWLAVIERSAHLWIYVTGLAFHFLLSAYWQPQGLRGVANLLLHYAVPIGAFVAWLLFHQKGNYRLRELWIWASYPVLYLAFTLVRGHVVGFYPYWFLDPNKGKELGISPDVAIVLIVVGLILAFLTLGLALTGVDAAWAAIRGRNNPSNPGLVTPSIPPLTSSEKPGLCDNTPTGPFQ